MKAPTIIQNIYQKSPNRIKPLLQGAWFTVADPDSSPEKRRGYGNPHDFPKDDLYEILDVSEPTIIESGANDGGNTGSYLRIFDNPTIHAIEPLPKPFEELSNTFSDNENVILYNCALGDREDRVDMNVYEDDGSSSVFESNKAHQTYGGESKVNLESTITVQQTTIDNLMNENDLVTDIDIINLDMQGYELNALKGANRVLENCKAIIVEVSFVPLYNGQPLFCDISSFLSEYDFHIYDLYFRWKGENGEITHGDAVFLNKSVYKESGFEVNPFTVFHERDGAT